MPCCCPAMRWRPDCKGVDRRTSTSGTRLDLSAIAALSGRGDPVDTLTVADELRRSGKLDLVGDISVLISLATNTPSIGSADYYAQIVLRDALDRWVRGQSRELDTAGASGDRPRQRVIAAALVDALSDRERSDLLRRWSMPELLAEPSRNSPGLSGACSPIPPSGWSAAR